MASHASRKQPRVAARLQGMLRGREERRVRLLDLSAGGCLVQGDARLARGAIHDLLLELEDGALSAKVRVADSALDGSSLASGSPLHLSGLEFIALSPQAEQRLLRLVEQLRRSGGSGAA